MTAAGGQSVFSNEWDKWAATTYASWYEDSEVHQGDLRLLNPRDEIPNHDVLSAGFPCQPFSIAGVAKKNSLGRPHGFSDLQQGNLFFALCDVISAKKPKVVLLENVKNILGHDKGKTWTVIRESLDMLGYHVVFKVINAAAWVPQNRKRVFIVAFEKTLFSEEIAHSFQFPDDQGPPRKLEEILDKEAPDEKYMLTDNLWKYLQGHKESHLQRGNGFGFKLYDGSQTAGTLSARYYKDGAEILIKQKDWRNPRRLTPNEAAKLMGFNVAISQSAGMRNGFPQVVSDMQAYKQFGNSVCPLIVHEIAVEIAKLLNNLK